jgi:predicted peptidase
MHAFRYIPFAVLLPTAAMHIATHAQDMYLGFEGRSHTSSGGHTMVYRLFIPSAYDSTHAYPLVVHLHHATQTGNDNRITIDTASLIWTEDDVQGTDPVFILTPQVPTGEWWVNWFWGNGNYNMDEVPISDAMANTIEIIEEILGEFFIDTNRVYVTGGSMGGFGCWDLITRRPDLFVAAIPYLGGGDPRKADRIAGMSIWAFHGALDDVVPVEATREMVDSLRAARARMGPDTSGELRYTEYPDVGHGDPCWKEKIYKDPDLRPWVLRQSKNSGPTSVRIAGKMPVLPGTALTRFSSSGSSHLPMQFNLQGRALHRDGCSVNAPVVFTNGCGHRGIRVHRYMR